MTRVGLLPAMLALAGCHHAFAPGDQGLPSPSGARAVITEDRARSSADEDYVSRILASTDYDIYGSRLQAKNSQVPKHDPSAIERLFEEHKGRIVRHLAGRLKTYGGAEYPCIAVSVRGWPVAGEGTQIAFKVSVRASSGPDLEGGTRALPGDYYRVIVLFDVPSRRVTKADINAGHLGGVPRDILAKAMALAEPLDPHYKRPGRIWVRWLPRWYVRDHILRRKRQGKSVAGEYSVITSDTKGNVVLLPFDLPHPDRQRSTYHVVAVDVSANAVLGVYKGTRHIGPMY